MSRYMHWQQPIRHTEGGGLVLNLSNCLRESFWACKEKALAERTEKMLNFFLGILGHGASILLPGC